MSFTTVDNVKVFLNKAVLTQEQTATVQMLIGLIDGVISNYCGWQMLSTTYTGKKYDGDGRSELDLRVYPITSVTKVMVNGEDVTASVSINADEGIIYFPSGSGTFTTGKLNVEVDFVGGFVPGSIPSELVYAANYLTTINYNRIDSENIGVSAEKFNQVEVKYDTTDIPVLVKRVLDRFRSLRVF
jgi:hypothetical protein